MSEIKVGDWIEVLKGVTLYPYVYPPQGRKAKGMVKSVITERTALAGVLQTQEQALTAQRRVSQERATTDYEAAYEHVYAEMADEILAPHVDRPQVMVSWGDGYTAFIDDVRKIDVPVSKIRPPTKTQKMVAKSVWRVTETIDINVPISNPAYRAEYERASKTFLYPPQRHQWTVREHSESVAKFQDHLKTCGIPHDIDAPYVRIQAGTELVVGGKRSTYGYYEKGAMYSGKSFLYPFYQPKSGITWLTKNPPSPKHYMQIPFDLIDKVLEECSVPLVTVCVLRDRETGQFFKEAQQKWRGGEAGLLMVDSYQHARKFGDLGVLKTSVIDWTGYAHGMPESHDDDRPTWLNNGGPKIADFPSTWDVLVYDKLAKTEIPQDPPIDIQDWYTRLWQMRQLTIDHGTVVRKLYNDLDKKGEVEAFSYILALRCPLDQHGNYPRGFTEEEVAAFDEVIERSGLKRTDMRRGKHAHSMAVAVRDPDMAFQMRFTYGGTLPIAVLNLRTLKEEVRGPQPD